MIAEPLARRLPATVTLRAVTYAADAAKTWTTWLSAEETACLETFGAESRRREFVAGRAAARQLLADALSVPPAAVPLRRDPDGGVSVEAASWHVSIAHSGAHALAAAAGHAVGADLEHIEPRDPAVADFLFDPDDRDWPGRLPYDADAALILCWVLKEATLKARRSGFRTSPKALRLAVDPEAETATIRVEGGRVWQLVYARLGAYWGAVAWPDRTAAT
jgi:4'-phosphopantetheinyl transferase